MLLTVPSRWFRCCSYSVWLFFCCFFFTMGASFFKVFHCSLSSCFFNLFSIVITSLVEEGTGLTGVILAHFFVCFWRVSFCHFSLPLGVGGWLRFVIVARPGLLYYFCITQLKNGSIAVWMYGVGQSIWDIFLNSSQRIFVAQWVTSLQHGSLSSNLIGQNGFFVTQTLAKRLKFKKKFNIPYSSVVPIRWGMPLENLLLEFHWINIKVQFMEN